MVRGNHANNKTFLKKITEKSGNFISPEKWEPCINVWDIISDSLKQHEGTISKLFTGRQLEESVVFDRMVANILSEHKDEIKRNVEQQKSKLVSNRSQEGAKENPISFEKMVAGIVL